MGEGQTFEKPNVKLAIFRNFEIPNMKRTKDELFDFFLISNLSLIFIFV